MCRLCNGRGWLLQETGETLSLVGGDAKCLEVVRCPGCKRFASDEAARRMVAAELEQDGAVRFECCQTAD